MAITPVAMPEAYMELFEKNGYAVIKGLFSAPEVFELTVAFDRVYEEAMLHKRSFRMQNVFLILLMMPRWALLSAWFNGPATSIRIWNAFGGIRASSISSSR